MKFKLRAMDADAQDQQNPNYHSQSSPFSFFTEQAIPVAAGYRNENFGGGRVGQDAIRGRFEMRETIRRELEKERIREEIIAEEMARKRLLEAEVRNELMMEREMAMRRGGCFSSLKFLHRQPEGKLVMSIDEKYGREIRGFSVPLLRDSAKIKGIPTSVSEDNEKEPDGEALSGTKRQSVSEGSSLPGAGRSKKKVKEEWSCAICQVSTTSERGLAQHLRGKKHQTKEAALVAQKTGANFGLGVAPMKPIIKPMKLALTSVNPSSSETSKPSSSSDPNDMNKNGENKRDKFKFWCEMCRVGAFSETVMNDHKGSKKHSARLIDRYRKGKVDSEASATENTCETKTNPAMVVATVADEVKPVKDDMECVAEENNTTTTSIGEHGYI